MICFYFETTIKNVKGHFFPVYEEQEENRAEKLLNKLKDPFELNML